MSLIAAELPNNPKPYGKSYICLSGVRCAPPWQDRANNTPGQTKKASPDWPLRQDYFRLGTTGTHLPESPFVPATPIVFDASELDHLNLVFKMPVRPEGLGICIGQTSGPNFTI